MDRREFLGAMASIGISAASTPAPPAGFGGRLMRTVCFFWADASAVFGGSAAAGGLTGGVFSDIGFSVQTLGIGFRGVNGIVPRFSGQKAILGIAVRLAAGFISGRVPFKLNGCTATPSS